MVIAGQMGCDGGKVTAVSEIASLNIRIAHQIRDVAMPLMPYIRDENSIYNTLVISRLGEGKTTFLRDCIRILSDGCDGKNTKRGGDEVELPDYLREEAGIPEKAKLCASVDEDEHTVTISEADYDYDLRDVPEEVLEMFRDAEICVGELEERLILGDVVYGD